MQNNDDGPASGPPRGPAGEGSEDLRRRTAAQASAIAEAARSAAGDPIIEIVIGDERGQVTATLMTLPEPPVPLEIDGERGLSLQTVNELRGAARKLLSAAQRVENAAGAINSEAENSAARHRREVREEVLRQRRRDAQKRPPDSPRE